MPQTGTSSWRNVLAWRPAWTIAEFSILAALCVIAGTGFAMLKLASEINEGETHAFDTAILLAFRNPADLADPIGPRWVEQVMRDFTSLGSHAVLTLITLVALGYLLIERKARAATFLLVAIGGGTLLSTLLKLGFDRPRPDLVAHAVDVWTASFPSGHALMSAVTYLTLGALLARVQARPQPKLYFLGVAVVITLTVGVSRVYLGVHWPTDVLAGWSIGAAWALSCWLVSVWLEDHGKVEGGEVRAGSPTEAAKR
jgi:undecaprenyl-diphosphatase